MTGRSSSLDSESASLKAAGDIGYRWELSSDALELSGELLELFGMPDRRLLLTGEALIGRIEPQDFQSRLPDRLDRAGRFERDYRLRLSDGRTVWVQDRGRVEFDFHGAPVRLTGVLRRITEQKDRETFLRDIAERDRLTGRYNRQRIADLVEKAFTRRQPGEETAAYIVLGIDHMAAVNDAIGPTLGDIVLRGVADRLESLLPPAAILGRVGGDTFGILCEGLEGPEATTLAEAILEVFREMPIETPLCPVHISVSAGAVLFPDGMATPVEVLIRAEQALREAQRKGRNTFILYQSAEGRREAQRRSLEIGHMVQRALKDEGIRLAFQPIVAGAAEPPMLYEALARLIGPDGAPVPAALFIPVVERLGLSAHLDRKVLDLAIAELEKEPRLHLAINISGMTVGRQSMTQLLVARLQGRPDIARRLIFEITETAAIADVEQTALFVEMVRALGGKVALDDFGAGFTSIRHLRALKVEWLKIDRDILSNVAEDREQQVLANMVLGLARGLGLKTIAEGVETAEAAEWLKRHQADWLQGYHFGRPTLDRPWAPNVAVGATGTTPKVPATSKPVELPIKGPSSETLPGQSHS